MNKKLEDKIRKRIEEGTYRSLSSFAGKTDFFSNNYLSLELPEEKISGIERTGSRLISGNSERKMAIENELASWFDAEAGLIFNSGYDANLGFFSSIPQREDTVLYDELIHASVRDGVRLGFAKALSFKHNDLADLENKLRRASGTVYIAVESLYSMSGDLAPLNEIVYLAEKFSAHVIVDEAHACGVYGDKGKGLTHEMNLQNKIFARTITFGKAYGQHGAMILGSEDLKNYLINFARPFIYTTALPDSMFERILSAVTHSDLKVGRERLAINIRLFRDSLTLDCVSDKNSPIQVIRFQSREELKRVEQKCLNANLAVKAIFPPTVPENESCLRICLHANDEFGEILRLVGLINN